MKAQTGIEFFFAISIALVILAFSYSIFASQQEQTSWQSDYLEAKKICTKISNSLDSVLLAGNGFNQTILIPSYLNSKNYTIKIFSSQKLIEIVWDNNLFTCKIFSDNVWNSTSKDFLFGKGNRKISNIKGKIIVS